MASTRLPGKVLADLGGRTVLEWVVRAAWESGVCDRVVVATSTDSTDDAVESECQRLGVSFHRGDLDDVLGRFLGALIHEPDDGTVIRLTADCPLLDPQLIAMCVRAFEKSGVDYLSTIRRRTLPRGLDVEVMSHRALKRAGDIALGYQRIHVTPAIYEDPAEFTTADIAFEPVAGDLRVTIDTSEDLTAVRALVDTLGDRPHGWQDVIRTLRSHPEIVGINRGVKQKALEDG